MELDLTQLFFNEMPDALRGLSPDGGILFGNRGARGVIAYSAEEAVDRIAFDFLSLKTAMKYSATFCTRPEKADLPHIRHCADERAGRREFPKGISIVALTTSAMKGADARVIDTRCADYIAKRIDIWQFSDKVASYLDIADVQT